MRYYLARLTAIFLAAAMNPAMTVSAQIFSPLHIFSTATGSVAPLTQDADGTLYGVSVYGGVSGPGFGTVFKVQPDGTGFDIMYSFTNGSDGSGPAAGLIISGNTLYGTAENGGSGGRGTVFQINTDGTGFTTLHSFTGTPYPFTNIDGANPLGSLVLAGGTLYGTASTGGSSASVGTIFKVNTDGSGFTNFYTFSGLPRSIDGARPMAGMLLSGSTLYGTTEGGGTNGYGTVFEIDTSGTGFATLHTFPGTVSGTNSDGAQPEASLILSGGTLYGTTQLGGKGHGTLFSLNTGDSSFTNLYNFTNGIDGSTPVGALALLGGTLYGTASSGGNSPGWGTVFKLNTDGTGFTNLYEFAQGKGGTRPMAGLLLSGSALYGTTPDTGTGGVNSGTVFKLNTDGSGYTVLDNGSDGAQPQGGLLLSGDSFYGAASAGGSTGAGVVFRVSTNGASFATLHTFSVATYDSASGGNYYTNADGATPVGDLASSNGVLYGTTEIGGSFGGGTVYRVNTDGTGFTNLYNFMSGTGGESPAAGLVLAGSTLYGTADGGFSYGAVFKINTDGTGFTNLYNFSATVSGTNSDGSGPLSGLAFWGETLYGTAYYGGPRGGGTLFKINTNGTGFTAFYNFAVPLRLTNNDPFGANPASGLIVSGNTLYGTTLTGPPLSLDPKVLGGPGTVFKINTDGTGFVTLYQFTNAFGGSAPKGALVLSGGTLYGTTSSGGNGSAGTVFELNTDGSGFTPLHTFPFQQGTPLGDLVAIGNTVYGTSEYGAPGSASSLVGAGSVFAVTPTATPSIQFIASPTNGVPPQAVQFTSPSVDDDGNTIIQWTWDFGDGVQFSGAANPAHTYTNEGPFTPTLIAINNNGASIIGSGPVIDVVYPSSILNGGFETDTFTNWTRSGSASQTISANTNYAHSGKYGAQLSASGSLGYLSETLSTTPGTAYSISFWLHNPTSKTNNEFLVSWNGTVLLGLTNLPVTGWTNIQLVVTATAGTSVLEFGYRNDTAYFGLDDVSVASAVSAQPGIASFNLSGTNLVLNATGGLSGQTYYVLMGTNLAEPIAQWTPVATNVTGGAGEFSITATNAVNPNAPQRFFILQLQ